MSQLELVAISGPVEGNRFPLRLGEALLIGRTNHGVHLPDLAVSVKHAKLEWAGGQLMLTDLESASGTFVSERQLEPLSSALVELGDVIRIGATQLKVVRVRTSSMLRLVLFASIALVLVFICFSLFLLPYAVQEGGSRLVWERPINVAPGQAMETVEIPPAFMRRHGLLASNLSVRYVRDVNKDGVDEVWLRTSKQRDFLISFGPDATWVVLAELPEGCNDRTTVFDRPESIPDWPDIRCGGEIWSYREGLYTVAAQDGHVVWVDPSTRPAPKPGAGAPGGAAPASPAPTAPGALVPLRVHMVVGEKMSSFLASRGVDEPVHYIVCEGALPGVAAQARTGSGELVRLSLGCLTDLHLDGEKVGRLAMVAFSAVGRQALLDDIEMTWGGSSDRLWLDPTRAALLNGFAADPGMPRGATRLVSTSDSPGAPMPTLPEVPLTSTRRLIPDKGEAAPPAVTANLLSSGMIRLDPPGCSELVVTVDDWRCRTSKACTSGSTFIEVVETGCGAERTILSAPYASGTLDGQGSISVRVQVEVHEVTDGWEVVQARIGYLPPA